MRTFVQLRVAGEGYAVAVEHALQIADFTDVTAVPGSPPALLGICSLRAQILAVIDLAVLLDIPRKTPPSHLLVAEAGGGPAGLAIDEVSAVGELSDPTEETESDLLSGAVLTDGHLVGVINVARVFDAAGRSGGA